MRRREPEVTIRAATGDDEAAIHALHAECAHDLFAGLLGDYVPPAEQRAQRERSWTAGRIGSPRERHALLVAERRELVVGFVAVGPTRDADDDRHTTGELRTVMVADSARASGVGRALIAAGELAMREHGCSIATLWVVPENAPAVLCYERCGWHPDGGEKSLTVDGHEIRAVRYSKQILR